MSDFCSLSGNVEEGSLIVIEGGPVPQLIATSGAQYDVSIPMMAGVETTITMTIVEPDGTTRTDTYSPTRAEEAGELGVSGRVVDTSGRPVQGAEVEAGNQHTQTGADGTFRFDTLSVGHRILRTSAPGHLARLDAISSLLGDDGVSIVVELSELGPGTEFTSGQTDIDLNDAVSIRFGPQGAPADGEVSLVEAPQLGGIPSGSIVPLFDLSPARLGEDAELVFSLPETLVDLYATVPHELNDQGQVETSLLLYEPQSATYRYADALYDPASGRVVSRIGDSRGETVAWGPFTLRIREEPAPSRIEALPEEALAPYRERPCDSEGNPQPAVPAFHVPVEDQVISQVDVGLPLGSIGAGGYSFSLDELIQQAVGTGTVARTVTVRIPAGNQLPARVWFEKKRVRQVIEIWAPIDVLSGPRPLIEASLRQILGPFAPDFAGDDYNQLRLGTITREYMISAALSGSAAGQPPEYINVEDLCTGRPDQDDLEPEEYRGDGRCFAYNKRIDGWQLSTCDNPDALTDFDFFCVSGPDAPHGFCPDVED